MERSKATKSVLVAIVAGFLMALIIPGLAAPAQAASVAPATNSATQKWAYGGEQWVNITGIGPNSTYSIHAFFGWSVVFTATNTSPTTVALEAQRTAAAYLYADFCTPNCNAPIVHTNLSANAWEADTGFANFTTTATVYEHGSPVAALGILNASASSAGMLNESMTLMSHRGSTTADYSASLKVTGNASASIDFSPALGLVPWSVATGDSWNSSSAFTAHGGWQASWAAEKTTPMGKVTASGHPTGSVSASGTIALNGTDIGTITLKDGKTVPVIVLEISGPFDCLDGVILIPHDFDLFGGAAHDWDGYGYGSAQLLTSKVDLFVDALHHRVIFDAAAAHASAANTALPSSPVAMTASTSSPAAPISSGAEIQAQPETVGQAQQQATCLSGGCVSHTSNNASMLTALAIGLAIAAVVGTVGVIEYRAWSKRRGQAGLPPSDGQAPSAGPPPPPGATMAPPPPLEPPKRV